MSSLAIVNRQSSIANPQDWLRLDDAAALLGLSPRTLRFRAAQWARSGKAQKRESPSGAPTWYIHSSVDPRLSRCHDARTREERVRDDLLASFPRHHLERAHRKAHWMHQWRKRLTVPRLAGKTDLDVSRDLVADAKHAEDDGFKISVRSLQIWWNAYNEIGDDGQVRGLHALVDRYRDRPRFNGATPGDGPSRSPQAIQFFYSVYWSEHRLSIRQCHGMTLARAKMEGWHWAPGVSATAVWLRNYDDRSKSFKMRFGRTAWARKFMPYAEQDWRAVEPSKFYAADHARCDFWVVHRGKLIRPWLTAVQDCRSRRIVGWTLVAEANQDSIIVAMRMAFHEAVPDVFRLDNGKDFSSKAVAGDRKAELRRLRAEYGKGLRRVVEKSRDLVPLTNDPRWSGVTAELGVDLIFAVPHSPWSKGTLERFFRTFHEQCGKGFATYCGNNTVNRPEAMPEVLKGEVIAEDGRFRLRDGSCIPSMEEAEGSVRTWIDLYHLTPHCGRGIDGRTPMSVWNSAVGIRKVLPEYLDFLMGVRGVYKVGPNGVTLTISGSSVSYGQRSAALRRWTGREVLVHQDPEIPARCLAFDPDTRRLIDALEANERIHPAATMEEFKEKIREVRRGRVSKKRFAQSSARRSRSAAQLLNQDTAAKLSQLQAMGTDIARPHIPTLMTGFERQSKPVPAVFETIPDEYAAVNLSGAMSHARQGLLDGGGDESGDPYAAVSLADLHQRGVESDD